MKHGDFIRIADNKPFKMRRSDGKWGVHIIIYSTFGNGELASIKPFWRKVEALKYIERKK